MLVYCVYMPKWIESVFGMRVTTKNRCFILGRDWGFRFAIDNRKEGGVFDFKNLLLLLHHDRSSQQLRNCCILFFATSLLMFLSCVGGAWSDYQQLVLSIVFYRTESNSSRAMYISFDAIL